MTVKASIYCEPFRASASAAAPVSVSCTLLPVASIRVSISPAIKVATALLSGFILAAARPLPSPVKVTATLIREAGPGEIQPFTTNFVTLDNQMIMTADGRIFHVSEGQ